MKLPLRLAWEHHPWLSLAFVSALLLAAGFVIKTVAVAIYWSQPEHQKQALQAWMTPRYVVHSWDLEREDVIHLFGENQKYKGKTLGQMADDMALPFAEFAVQMQTELEAIEKAVHE